LNGEMCLNCRFWDPYDSNPDNVCLAQGDCRRFPPNVPVVNEYDRGVQLMTHPMTFDEEWCGEWKPKSQGDCA